jgi:integrase
MKSDKQETTQAPPKRRKLKARTAKKRKGTRTSDVSLNVDDYEQSSVARAVCHELSTKEPILAESTFVGMKTHARHIIRHLGAKSIDQLCIEDIEILRTTLLKAGCRAKVINGCYTILRAICSKAQTSGHQKYDLMQSFKNLKVVNEEPHPLNEEEVRKLLLTETDDHVSKDMTLFGLLTALRISELICATWENVEFYVEEGAEKCRLFVDLAKPINQYKVTKTKESTRMIELSSEAAKILRRLHPITGMKAPISIDIVERDNITVRKDKRRFIFINDRTGRAWINSKQFAKQFFTKFLAKANVAHRGPNQLRHSCASVHYNSGTSVAWIADLLGHKDVSIVEQHYAKRNKVSLKKEQKKAEKTISSIFKVADDNSIKVSDQMVTLKQRSNNAKNRDNDFIKTMLELARNTNDKTHREQIIQAIAYTLDLDKE